MATRLPLFLALATLCMSTTACTYLGDRVRDLMDIAGIDILTGLQAGASVRATKAAQVGLAGFNGDAISWDGRTLAAYEETRLEGGVSIMYTNSVDRIVNAKNSAYDQRDYYDEFKKETFDLARNFDRAFFEFGFRVNVLVIGVGGFVDPIEMGDFVLGIFGVDFCRDDARNVERYMAPPGIGWPRVRKVPDAVQEAMKRD